MIRAGLSLGAMLASVLLSASGAVGAEASGDRTHWGLGDVAGRWLRVGPADGGTRVTMELVRADVDIERGSASAVEVRVASADPALALARVSLRADRDGGSLKLTDVYPRVATLWTRECLPPPTERGDFWSTPVRLRVRVRVPAGTAIDVRVLDGKVRDLR